MMDCKTTSTGKVILKDSPPIETWTQKAVNQNHKLDIRNYDESTLTNDQQIQA